ncbi:MAG: hypothetical protein H6719_09350 [Sandaracinaceae bacterium]|nr:hypothetical protein [Sandaracinaceae bacterium]
MGWLGNIFGSRKRREARREVEERLREVLERDGSDAVWPLIVEALRLDPEDDGLYHLAGHVLRLGGEARTGELFDRAADAPHDPQRLFELGSALLSDEEPIGAAAVLGRAIAMSPFDAVVRSELALAHARSGEPDKVLATLALHPCLADDPGALFELAWASLLKGDLDTAEGATRELHGVRPLRHKLELAIDRAKASPPMRDARDFYFVEHGAILIDGEGPLGGRYEKLAADADWVAAVLGDAGAVIERLQPAPHRVIAIDEEHWPLAEAVAGACGGSVIAAGRGRLPAAILPLLSGEMIEERVDADSRRSPDLWIFALTADHRRSLARAPELVGAFARETTLDPATLRAGFRRSRPPSSTLLDFVESRRDYLPPRGDRVRAAYVPDAPLPR